MSSNSYYRLSLVQERALDGRVRWIASYPDLPGCTAVEGTPDAAVAALSEALPDWLALAAESGAPIESAQSNPEFEIEFAADHTPEDRELARQALNFGPPTGVNDEPQEYRELSAA